MSLLLAMGLVGNVFLFKGQMAIDSPRMTSASMMQLHSMRSLTLECIWLLDRVLGRKWKSAKPLKVLVQNCHTVTSFGQKNSKSQSRFKKRWNKFCFLMGYAAKSHCKWCGYSQSEELQPPLNLPQLLTALVFNYSKSICVPYILPVSFNG